MTGRLTCALASAAVAIALVVSSAGATAPTTVRLDGIGPLRLGMTQGAAVATGWLAKRGTGCELGGKPYPVTYRFVGPKAPAGIDGVAQFDHGRLSNLSFTAGVSTERGTVPRSTTIAAMVAAYRGAGYKVSAKYDSTFQGTFVEVMRAGKLLVSGFGEKKVVTVLALPAIPVCE